MERRTKIILKFLLPPGSSGGIVFTIFLLSSSPPGGSGWCICVRKVCHVIHPQLRRVETPGGQKVKLQLDRRDIFFLARCSSFHTLLFSPSFSVAMSYFILAITMRKCLGEHSCMSSTFPIAMLNRFFSHCSAKTWIRSGSRVLLN